MFNQMVSQPLNLRLVFSQNLKSAQACGVSIFTAFGFGQFIQKANDFSIVCQRRVWMSMAVEQLLRFDTGDAHRQLIDEWQMIGGTNIGLAATIDADLNFTYW